MKNTTTTVNLAGPEDLASHREQCQLSVTQVADEIKVSRDFIRYIETGQFEKLGAATFLKGHLKNYCKALGLNSAQVLGLVPDHLLQTHQLTTSNTLGTSPLAKVKKHSNHWGKQLVGTALLAMLGLSFYFIWDKWSWASEQQTEPQTIDLAENTDAKQMTYSSLLPQVGSEEMQTAQAGNEQTESLQPESEVVDDQDQLPTAVETELGVETDAIDEDREGTLPESTPMLHGYQIDFNLKEQVWVSVKTEAGDVVIHDLIGPGVRSYHSEEPVHFRIGNASQLSLSINQEFVDLTPHTNKNVADFDWPLNSGP